MFQYHGWMSTYEDGNISDIRKRLRELNRDYPISAANVNGAIHISFSGSPNRDLGELEKTMIYLSELNLKFTGCVYVNDPDSKRYDQFDIIKIVRDKIIKLKDQNFTLPETQSVFK